MNPVLACCLVLSPLLILSLVYHAHLFLLRVIRTARGNPTSFVFYLDFLNHLKHCAHVRNACQCRMARDRTHGWFTPEVCIGEDPCYVRTERMEDQE